MPFAENSLAALPSVQTPFELELAGLIVDTLQLDMPATDISPEDALFRDGLGLDSIDALELSLAISRRYGVELKSDDARNGEIFANLRSLAGYLGLCRTK